MYRVSYVEGNGYHCGCCRREESYTADFKTKEGLIEWLVEFQADIEYSKGDNYDKFIESIEKEIGVDILSNYVNNKHIEALVKEEVNRRKAKDLEKKEAKEKEEAVRKEKEEKEQLKKLKEKYES